VAARAARYCVLDVAGVDASSVGTIEGAIAALMRMVLVDVAACSFGKE
jgi:hypothetical protein